MVTFEEAKLKYKQEKEAGHLYAAATWLIVMDVIKEEEQC